MIETSVSRLMCLEEFKKPNAHMIISPLCQITLIEQMWNFKFSWEPLAGSDQSYGKQRKTLFLHLFHTFLGTF